jgi:hypothetical protein
VKTHRFFRGITVCGVDQGVNAADMDPPEVTCRRCMKIPPGPFEACHYARAPVTRRVFIAEGFPPDPERPWTAEWTGKL